MKKYYANFNANNGTRFSKPIEGTNKRSLKKEIVAIANGYRFRGSELLGMLRTRKESTCTKGSLTIQETT